MREGITFAGSMIVDHLKTVDAYPREGELAAIRSLSCSPGGLVCNTACALKALDQSVRVYAEGAVGNDADGEMLLSFLSTRGIDVSAVKREGVTSFTDVVQTPSQRTFFQYGGACDSYAPTNGEVAAMRGRLLHVGYLLLLPALDAPDSEFGTVMARVLREAKKNGMETSVDCVSECGDRYKSIVPPALMYTDYLTVNETEASAICGIPLRDGETLLEENIPSVLAALKNMGVSKWVTVHCPEGAFGCDERGRISVCSSARLPKGYIAGKVGAGDAFCAGVLLAAYRGLSQCEALRCGNAAAQASLRSENATDGLLPLEAALAEFDRFEKLDTLRKIKENDKNDKNENTEGGRAE